MSEKRYIPCKALQINNNEFIPFWELGYVPSDGYYGDGFKVKGDFRTYYGNLNDCLYDVKKKKIVLGIVIDYYEDNSKLEFKVGDKVFAELSHRDWFEDEIESISYEEYEVNIYSGKSELLECYITKEQLKDVKATDLYEIRLWKPYYKLKNSGKIIKYDFYMKKRVDTPNRND